MFGERRAYVSVICWLRYISLPLVFLGSGWTTCIMPSLEDNENREGKLNDGILRILEKVMWEVKWRDLQNKNL